MRRLAKKTVRTSFYRAKVGLLFCYAAMIFVPWWNRPPGLFVLGCGSSVLVGPTPPSARDPWSRSVCGLPLYEASLRRQRPKRTTNPPPIGESSPRYEHRRTFTLDLNRSLLPLAAAARGGSGSASGMDLRGNPGLEFVACGLKFVSRPHVEPVFGSCAEIASQPERRFRRDRTLARNDGIDPIGWNMNRFRHLVHAQAEICESFLQYFPRVHRGEAFSGFCGSVS